MNLEDRAKAHEAQEWALRNHPREVLRYKPDQKGYGPAECDCGADMHPVRRAWGFTNCVPCASLAEAGRR